MARARNIKPAFFKNDILAELPPLARLLFVGLWCIADREGRLEDRVKRIKVEVLPYDSCNIEDLLTKLHDAGFIVRYQIEGNQYIQITNFTKHQNPHIKEQASEIPAPDLHQTSTVQVPNEHGTSPADSLNPLIDSLKPIVEPPHIKIQHLTVSKEEHEKLVAEYGLDTVKSVYEGMTNYAKLKDYKSGYLTANNWCKRRKEKEGSKSSISGPITEVYRRREASQ